MVFKERLKELRKTKKLTQKQIAEFLNISESQYKKYEYGIYEPDIQKLIKLATLFDVTIDYLVCYKNN